MKYGEIDKKEGRHPHLKRFVSFAKLVVFFLIFIGIPSMVAVYYPGIISRFRNLDDLNAFLDHYKTTGIFIYLLLQMLQILIPIIPGQALQLAAGYLYHFLPGLGLSLLGIALGTTVSFGLARFLGHDAMVLIFGEEKMREHVRTLNSKRSYKIIFLLYLMPGFPKDFVCFAAGVSEVRFLPFLIVSLVGRTPALMLSIIIGNMTRAGSYHGALIVGIAAVLLFLLFLWKRRELMEFCDRIYERLIR